MHTITLIACFFFIACSNRNIKDTIENYSKYTSIRDNLYSDKEGNLYLKSVNNEDVENKYDVWLKNVYCDTCWRATEEGFKDVTELNDVVDVNTFHFVREDIQRGGDLYEDKKYMYFHKWMADGGTITLMAK